jgi:hypothetical protein
LRDIFVCVLEMSWSAKTTRYVHAKEKYLTWFLNCRSPPPPPGGAASASAVFSVASIMAGAAAMLVLSELL